MTKIKYYPLRRGFNECLGIYEKRDDSCMTKSKRKSTEKRETPKGIDNITEVSIPTSTQYLLNYDMY